MSQQPSESPQTPSDEPQTPADQPSATTIRLTRWWQWALVAVVIVAMYLAVDFVASRACDALGSVCADGEGSVSTILHRVLDDFSFVGILVVIWVAAKLIYRNSLPRVAVGKASYGLNNLLNIALLVLCFALVFALVSEFIFG